MCFDLMFGLNNLFCFHFCNLEKYPKWDNNASIFCGLSSVLPPWCLQWCLTLITGKTSSDKATAIQSRVLFFAIKKYPTVLTQWQDLNFIALSLLCTSSRSLCVCHQHATCSSIFCPYHPTSFIFQLHCDFKGGVKILLSLFRIYPLKKQFVM